MIYLTYEQVVALNSRHGGEGAGVRDEGGIRAQLGRVEASFGGIDVYPDVWEKAAVLLHGLSSTQFFFDGNKRTAWLATTLFLGVNGHTLRDMPAVLAEAFVLSIATKAFEHEEEPERALVKAAEWFAMNALHASDRYHFAFLAAEANFAPDQADGVFHAQGALTSHVAADSYPTFMECSLVIHLRWHQVDAYESQTIRVYVEDNDAGSRLAMPTREAIARGFEAGLLDSDVTEIVDLEMTPIPGDADRDPNGMRPGLILIGQLFFILAGPGRIWIRIDLGQDQVTRIPLDIHQASDLDVESVPI